MVARVRTMESDCGGLITKEISGKRRGDRKEQMKKILIVNVLPEGDPDAQAAIMALQDEMAEIQVIQAYERNFRPCLGCNACWLKTPGRCSIRDGYEELLKEYLAADAVLFICGTLLNFVDFRMKNLIDRLLPLDTMYIRFVDGQSRHVPRYQKEYRFGLLYSGQADDAYLNRWLDRVMLNFSGKSLGAFPVARAKEAASCI